MQNDYRYAKHQKGKYPPFQKSKRGIDDWMRSLRSIDQHPYDLSDIQSLKQCVVSQIECLNREFDNVYLNNERGLGKEYKIENEEQVQ
jgi:hypothetical protein